MIGVRRIRVKENSNWNMRSRLRASNFELITVLFVTTDSVTDSDFEPDQSIKGRYMRYQSMDQNSEKARCAQVKE